MPSTPSRFPGGMTNAAPTALFNRMPVPDLSRLHLFHEDFDRYTAAQWALGGAGTEVAPALVAGDGGILSMANDAADNSNNYIQQLVTAWTLTSGKQLWFRARGTIDNATLCELVFGLQIAVAADNILTPADGLFIRKDATIATPFIVSRVGGVETVSGSMGTITAAVPFSVGFYYDGAGTIWAGLNDAMGVRITPASITAVALRITAGVQNGTAAARTLLLDQLFCAKER